MRKACPYCKLIMVPVYRFSKDRIEYLLKCDKCHYEEKSRMFGAKNNASKSVRVIFGVTNAN